MADMHKTPALALTLRRYAESAPSLMRPHRAAAAEAVEELSKLRAERDEARADARMWMDRYSSLFIRVSCAVAPDTTERGIYLAWQREVDEAFQVAALKGDAK